ncbi:MAG: ferritin-like domain-containing protein, partial [Alphaproteobacteria bacterium]|nr:ferritin-like domain-containing protein [Alphaproteobacteria bacterium]
MVDAMSSTLSFSGPRIAALAAKAERGQWLAVETQDWDERISLPWWLPRKFQAAVVSQFYHGEVATIRMCRKLLGAISDPTARRCVEWQIADEKRHAEVYLDYLRAVGPLQPMHPVLKAAAETALSWGENDPGLMTAAFTIILEAEAVFALNYLGRWLRCPKFRRINSRICKDEARHLAFGRIYLKQQFDGLDQQKRMQTYRRLRALWR